jgi:hypothetical protein
MLLNACCSETLLQRDAPGMTPDHRLLLNGEGATVSGHCVSEPCGSCGGITTRNTRLYNAT